MNVDPIPCKSDMRKKFKAIESLWYKGAEIFACGGEIPGWGFQISAIL